MPRGDSRTALIQADAQEFRRSSERQKDLTIGARFMMARAKSSLPVTLSPVSGRGIGAGNLVASV